MVSTFLVRVCVLEIKNKIIKFMNVVYLLIFKKDFCKHYGILIFRHNLVTAAHLVTSITRY